MNTTVNEGALVVPEEVQKPEDRQMVAPYGQSEAEFVLAQRQATALSKSDLVPDIYRNKPANVMIACELAFRLGCSPLMVMQNLFIVKGKPGFSGQFLIGLVNASPRFHELNFEIEGGPNAREKSYRIRAWAISKQTGERKNGAWIDWLMVDGEGWGSNPKWKNMPEQMFHYRAGTFFTRVHAPEIALGLLSREELEEMHGQIYAETQRLDSVRSALLGHDEPAAQTEPEKKPEPVVEKQELKKTERKTAPVADPAPSSSEMSFDEVEGNIEAATTREKLDDARDLIRYVNDSARRKSLIAIADQKQEQLERLAASSASSSLFDDSSAN